MIAGQPDGRLYLGWQYGTPNPDPGPPPPRPVPLERERGPDDWLAAQRREESLINRPVKLAVGSAAAAAFLLAVSVAAGWLPASTGGPALAVCLAVAALGGYPIWQGERALRARIADEQFRVARLRADAESRLFARQREHAEQAWHWQRRRFAFENQKRWYAVPLPPGMDRVDVAGGTLSGWSAVLTMAAAHLLAAGGAATVIDLSGGAVGADLVALAPAASADAAPAVWLLPQDLPRLDVAAALAPGQLAAVLALAVSAADERGNAVPAALDTAILDRVIGVLYPDGQSADPADTQLGGISLPRVAAGLRTLAQVGDPRADIAAGLLTEREAAAVSALYGQAASDRVIVERALAIEAHLRPLAAAGSEPPRLPRGRLRVIGLDVRTGALPARVLGTFVVGALTAVLGQASHGSAGPPHTARQSPWRHTVFLLGADRLPGDVLDRLTDACENARCGLVLAYRTIPPQVRQRIGRGNAAVAFMRLGNAEEAKAASEQIGTEHRFVLNQLTETVGRSVTDTTGISYTSTVGDSASVAVSSSDSESSSRGGGSSRTAAAGPLPFGGGQTSRSAEASTSRGTSESASLTAGISTSTAWGASTSRAVGDSESLAGSLQRSREFVVEAAELQRLPPTAMILSYAGPSGRRVLLADANPAIGGLPVATMTPLAETPTHQELSPAATSAGAWPAADLGPPRPRLDWDTR